MMNVYHIGTVRDIAKLIPGNAFVQRGGKVLTAKMKEMLVSTYLKVHVGPKNVTFKKLIIVLT